MRERRPSLEQILGLLFAKLEPKINDRLNVLSVKPAFASARRSGYPLKA